MPRGPLLFLKVSISELTPEQHILSMIGKMLPSSSLTFRNVKDTVLYPSVPFTPETSLFTTLGCPEQESPQATSPTEPPGCEGLVEAAAVLPCITEQVKDTCHVQFPAMEPGLEPCSFLLRFSVLEFHAKSSDKANHFRLLAVEVREIHI